MARFCTLYSGSDGNCVYVGGSDTAVLVDAGRSCKQLMAAMAARDIDPLTITAILITHEHSDHIKGLKVLLKKLPVPVYATSEVLEKLRWDHVLEPGYPVMSVEENETQQIGSFKVDCFDTPHDSIHSVGYRFSLPDGRSVAVATDMGCIRDNARRVLDGCDLVLLESNYDPNMLSVSDYPYMLKKRIASNIGHLSNDVCAEELVRLVRNGGTRLVLGHLSKNTNLPELALYSAKNALTTAGLRENLDYRLMVAPRDEPMEMMVV